MERPISSCGGNEVPQPQNHRSLREEGKGAAVLAFDEIAWKDKAAEPGSLFCPDSPKGGHLLSKADLCFLLESPLGACARPPAQAGSPAGPGCHHWAWLDFKEGKMRRYLPGTKGSGSEWNAWAKGARPTDDGSWRKEWEARVAGGGVAVGAVPVAAH